MQKRHRDRRLYFEEQSYTTKKYVIPFIERIQDVSSASRVLEVGCGEGGNMAPFLDMGCQVTGIDISVEQIERAKDFYASHPLKSNLTLIAKDIYKIKGLEKQFDIIILRDVIEHIPRQEYFLSFIKDFMALNCVLFIGFPPWQNPFGGHQQVCHNKVLSHTPWIHLLPVSLYRRLLQWGGVEPAFLLEVKKTGISLERFLRIVRREKYKIVEKELYIVNPNYEIKFGFRPRSLWKILDVPYLRNFYTTCGYFLLKLNKDESLFI